MGLNGRPWAEYVGITGAREAATLHAPKWRTDIRCPHPLCTYVARNELKRGPWIAMREHLAMHHEIECTTTEKWEWGPVPESIWKITTKRDWSTKEHVEIIMLWVKTPERADEPIEFVTHFPYLGSAVCRDGDLDPEIDIRIAKATRAFYSFPHRFWQNPEVSLGTKITIFEACVVSILTYAAESWTLSDNQESRLTAVYMRFLRTITGQRTFVYDYEPIGGTVEIVIFTPPNEYILQLAKTKAIADVLRQKRMRQLGTMIRRDPASFTVKASLVTAIPVHRGPKRMSWKERTKTWTP